MDKVEWRTLSKAAHISIEEKKSVFIAHGAPVASAQEAEAFLHQIRRQYPDARHHVFAWRTMGEALLQRYSDDGEPSGTAGLPVLNVLLKNQLDNAIIVVVRYFGGILLGTGGLVRAYGRAAFLAMEEAKPCLCKVCEVYNVMISYSYLERLRFVLAKAGFIMETPLYGLDPVLPVFSFSQRVPELIQLCADVTAGQAIVEYVEQRTIKVDQVDWTAWE